MNFIVNFFSIIFHHSLQLENKKAPKKKDGKKKNVNQRKRGVVYIKHLPHGFYEEQLRDYFSQFGAVTRVRLARSMKTLGSKGYAFIEFRYPEVAEIAAEAMNNYLMFKNLIKTRYIPPNEIKHDYFRSGVKKVKKDGVKVLTSKAIEARQSIVDGINGLMTSADSTKRHNKVAAKVTKSMKKLEDLGIDYDVDVINQSLKDKSNSSELDESAEMDVDIDSEDEIEDHFNEEDSDSDDDNVEEAVNVAKSARAKQDEKQSAKKVEKGKENVAKVGKKEAPQKVDKKVKKQIDDESKPAKKPVKSAKVDTKPIAKKGKAAKSVEKSPPVQPVRSQRTKKPTVKSSPEPVVESEPKTKKLAKSSTKIEKKKPAKKDPKMKTAAKNVQAALKQSGADEIVKVVSKGKKKNVAKK